ncbi:MAG: glycosyltransferase [Pseudohongiellaceae bacterium]
METVGSGGVEQRRLLLAQGLDPDRYEQVLICTQAKGGLPQRIESTGCRIHEVGLFDGISDKKPYRKALTIARQFRPHIIHGAVYEGVALAAIVGRIAQIPIIIGEETSDPVNRHWRGHVLYRMLAALTHRMVAVSPVVRDYLIKRIRLPEHKVTLINNGVMEWQPVPEWRIRKASEQLGLCSEDFVIGTVGRLQNDHKRHSDLIVAFKSVLLHCPNAKLLIVGAGSDEKFLKSLVFELRLDKQVIFAGYQGDTAPFYKIMDVFVLASAHEAFGLVLVEAMLAGVPVIATRVGGIPYIVEDGKTGFLSEPFQPDSIAGMIVKLYEDPEKRQQMARLGKRKAKAEFGADRYVSEVSTLYHELEL